jgi:hypothetical protein
VVGNYEVPENIVTENRDITATLDLCGKHVKIAFTLNYYLLASKELMLS